MMGSCHYALFLGLLCEVVEVADEVVGVILFLGRRKGQWWG
jgi:hypothetical protein